MILLSGQYQPYIPSTDYGNISDESIDNPCWGCLRQEPRLGLALPRMDGSCIPSDTPTPELGKATRSTCPRCAAKEARPPQR